MDTIVPEVYINAVIVIGCSKIVNSLLIIAQQKRSLAYLLYAFRENYVGELLAGVKRVLIERFNSLTENYVFEISAIVKCIVIYNFQTAGNTQVGD